MKKLLLFSLIIISNFANGQIEKNTNEQPASPIHKRSAHDIYLEIKASNKEPNPSSEYAKAISNNIYYNTDVGSSKYDSEINWATDINGDDVQDSVNKFRQKRQEEDFDIFIKIGLITACILGFFFLIYKILNDSDENSTGKTISLTNIKDITTIDSTTNSEKEDLEEKEGKVTVGILESQIHFLDKIIAARNGKEVCKNLEKILENTNTEILTIEESRDIMAKYLVISRVTSLMFVGLNEEIALQKTKADLTEELNKKTQDTLEGLLNNFYSKI